MLNLPRNAPARITGPNPFSALADIVARGDVERARNLNRTSAARRANRNRKGN